MYTAGPSGFLHILPVYLDHILHPNLREQDYLTEVHHINGEGGDAGVVYSEMQVGRQQQIGGDRSIDRNVIACSSNCVKLVHAPPAREGRSCLL